MSDEQTQRIRAAVEQHPRRMTMQLARDLGVSEAAVVRELPFTTPLDATRWEELIRGFEALGTVHVIVTNGGATLECVGQFGNFSTWEEFFNVQTDSLDMHIRWPELAAIFAVEKPSHMTGVNTLSVQFFDRAGAAAFKVFLNFGGKATPEMARHFDDLRQRFRS
ncbi:MAG: heme degradation protein [Planctomycetia bacterium]|nr:heme degradation protein [Planctomycetia bacterium]